MNNSKKMDSSKALLWSKRAWARQEVVVVHEISDEIRMSGEVTIAVTIGVHTECITQIISNICRNGWVVGETV